MADKRFFRILPFNSSFGISKEEWEDRAGCLYELSRDFGETLELVNGFSAAFSWPKAAAEEVTHATIISWEHASEITPPCGKFISGLLETNWNKYAGKSLRIKKTERDKIYFHDACYWWRYKHVSFGPVASVKGEPPCHCRSPAYHSPGCPWKGAWKRRSRGY